MRAHSYRGEQEGGRRMDAFHLIRGSIESAKREMVSLPTSLPHSPSLPSDILLQSIWLIDARKISLWHDRTDAASKKRDLSQIPDSTHFAFRVASLFLLPRIMQMEKEETEEREPEKNSRRERRRVLRLTQ